MRFLGQTEVAEFLRLQPAEADRIQAWLSEIRNREWSDAASLSADFRSVDTSNLPQAIFQLRDPPVQIETIIDFRNSVVLLRRIERTTDVRLVSPSSQLTSIQKEGRS
jgi:hypothetical protein